MRRRCFWDCPFPQNGSTGPGQTGGFGVSFHTLFLADVTQLPFADNNFDTVIATGAIGLFNPAMQPAALGKMVRVAWAEVGLLEAFEKRKGLYSGRVLAFLFDGMRPIPGELLADCGLAYRQEWDIMGGALSFIRCAKT